MTHPLSKEEYSARLLNGLQVLARLLSVVDGRPDNNPGSAEADVTALSSPHLVDLLAALEVLTVAMPLLHNVALDVMVERDPEAGKDARLRAMAAKLTALRTMIPT